MARFGTVWYNIGMTLRRIVFCAVLSAAAAAFAAEPVTSPGPGARYATDAYPGFDREEDILDQTKKEPGFFSWWSGPKYETPVEQLAWARKCAAEGSLGKARRAYDALVAEWPSSAEAPVAQKELADLCYEKDFDYEQAFAEYKYLTGFYSLQCDYDATVARMYEVARAMREAGKRILFFRFDNTTDVRRAFEAVVLRAPGASFAPQAMLAVAELREEDEDLEKAVEVYENLRSVYPGTREAKAALYREAKDRMEILREHEYNRVRSLDTVLFLKMALLADADPAERADFEAWQAEASALVEDEAYKAAKFYDSRTRTRRSAVNAYERFLRVYPASRHADEIRDRLAELREDPK